MRVSRPPRAARWGAVAAVLGAVLLGSFLPGAGGSVRAGWGHLLGYAALATALAAALDDGTRSPAAVLGGAFAGAVAVGAGVELLQPLADRHRELRDATLNAAGAALALVAYRLGHRWLRFR